MSSDEVAHLSAQVGTLTHRVELMTEHISSDHDLLIRIDANLITFMKAFLDHEANDVKTFAKHEAILDMHTKALYICVGGLMVFQVLLRVWFR